MLINKNLILLSNSNLIVDVNTTFMLRISKDYKVGDIKYNIKLNDNILKSANSFKDIRNLSPTYKNKHFITKCRNKFHF